MNKPGLVHVDKFSDHRPKPVGHDLCSQLHGAVLERDGSKIWGRNDTFFLGEEDKMRAVDAVHGATPGMEFREESLNLTADGLPETNVEGSAKTIRPRAGIFIHGKKGISDLIAGERGRENLTVHGGCRVKVRKIEVPFSFSCAAC